MTKSHTRKVLVVEDNELNMRLFCDLLDAFGFETFQCRDGAKAVEIARQELPDLIIMDIQLPHVSGLDLIAQMKSDAQLSAVPVLAVTAYAGKGDEDRIRAAGAEDYLAKPVSIGPFSTKVIGLIGE